MRYDHEIRRPHNAAQIVLRALQFALSEPRGPTYLIASRETLEEEVEVQMPLKAAQLASQNSAVEPIGLTVPALKELAAALLGAQRPLIVTGYCGRSAEGFEALKTLAEMASIPVHENAPIYNNFPTTSYLHQGHQWNVGGQLRALSEADVILVIDADVPWIGAMSKPSSAAVIYHLDSDPLKETTTLWSLPCKKRWKCDSAVALHQLCTALQSDPAWNTQQTEENIKTRKAYLKERFAVRQARLSELEARPPQGKLTVPFFMSRFRSACRGVRVVGLNESTTNLGNVADHLRHETALSLIGSGGGALGWYSGAAVGACLALQARGRGEDLVVAFTGDGTWLFGIPSCAYWMAKKYNTPFLTVIWNNGGWASPKNACLRLHPELASQRGNGRLSDALMASLTPSPSFGKIAEGAGDAWWTTVSRAEEVDEACHTAMSMVREERRSAVIEVVLDLI